MTDAQRIYEIAASHLQTVQTCVDRLTGLNAHEELRLSHRALTKAIISSNPKGGNQID
jgi:hypothetical protein